MPRNPLPLRLSPCTFCSSLLWSASVKEGNSEENGFAPSCEWRSWLDGCSQTSSREKADRAVAGSADARGPSLSVLREAPASAWALSLLSPV